MGKSSIDTVPSRRAVLRMTAAGVLAAGATPRQAGAQGWPARPIRFIVPYAPGGSTDASARIVAEAMARSLGQPVVVENRPGGTGTVGAGEVARAAPDGYTLLADGAGHGSNHALLSNLPFDYTTAFAQITHLTISPLIMAANPSLPAQTLGAFVTLARERPGQLSYGHPGNGSAGHLAGALLAHRAGLELISIAYRGGGPAVQDLLVNSISFTFASVPAALSLVQSGRLRALAVSSPRRIPSLPDVPAVAEDQRFPEFDLAEWVGLYAPAGTPGAILERIGEAARGAVREEGVRRRLEQIGSEPVGNGAAEFAAWLGRHRAAMSALVRDARITAE